jgi:hypothetical protein
MTEFVAEALFLPLQVRIAASWLGRDKKTGLASVHPLVTSIPTAWLNDPCDTASTLIV